MLGLGTYHARLWIPGLGSIITPLKWRKHVAKLIKNGQPNLKSTQFIYMTKTILFTSQLASRCLDECLWLQSIYAPDVDVCCSQKTTPPHFAPLSRHPRPLRFLSASPPLAAPACPARTTYLRSCRHRPPLPVPLPSSVHPFAPPRACSPPKHLQQTVVVG